MPSTYMGTAQPQPETIPQVTKQEADEAQETKNVGGKQQRPDVFLPEDVRRAFAVKIWVLLGMQMMLTGFVAAVVDRLIPDSQAGHEPDEEGYDELLGAANGLLIWLVSAVLCLSCLGVLRLFRHKVPVNFILLGASLPIIGFFWGAAKFILIPTFSLNLLAIVCLSLFGSSVLWASGLAQKLGWMMMPSEKKVQARLEKAEGKPQGSMDAGSDPTMQAQLKLIAQHDGLARSTIALGIFSWFAASAVDFVFVRALLQDGTSDFSGTKASVYAIGFGLFLTIWFHGDAVWHIRRCNVDEYLLLLIDVNTDIFAAMLALFACALAMACGETHDPAQVDGGAGGIEDVGATEANGGLPMGEVNVEGPKRNDEGLQSV